MENLDIKKVDIDMDRNKDEDIGVKQIENTVSMSSIESGDYGKAIVLFDKVRG